MADFFKEGEVPGSGSSGGAVAASDKYTHVLLLDLPAYSFIMGRM
jgi:hypothetical protein